MIYPRRYDRESWLESFDFELRRGLIDHLTAHFLITTMIAIALLAFCLIGEVIQFSAYKQNVTDLYFSFLIVSVFHLSSRSSLKCPRIS